MRWEAKYYRGEGQALEMERKVWGQALGWTARGSIFLREKRVIKLYTHELWTLV
jgi:hypothetical protein